MKTWDSFYPDVATEVPGAPDIVIDHALRNAAIEFCERTRVHVVSLDAEDSVSGVGEYQITPPSQAVNIAEVLSVSFMGIALEPRTIEAVRHGYGADWRIKTGVPACYTQQAADTLIIVPAPDRAETAAIGIDVALCPSPTAAGLDDWLFRKYRHAIAAGAKARMMAMAGVPWASPDRGDFYGGILESVIIETTSAARKSLVRAMPRFGGGFC